MDNHESMPASSASTRASALARRREQNREAMQRLRARRQRELQQLRLTVAELDAKRNSLLQQLDLDAPFLALPLPSMALDDAGRRAQQLALANQQLQCAIDGYAKWRDRLALLLEDLADDADSNSSATTAASLDDAGFDYVATPRLSAARAAELVLLHHRESQRVETKWLQANAASRQSQFFGWDLRYVLENDHWHYKFSKRITNVSAHVVADRAWRNALHLIVYRTWLPHQRIVQHINDDTFVLARWASVSATGEKTLWPPRVKFHMRFRMQEPDGSIGIAMQTLPSDLCGGGHEEGVSKDGVTGGEDMCVVYRITPERDDDGKEHCLVEYSGRIQFGGDAQSNALEVVLSLARWEELNVSKPPIMMTW